MCKARWEANYYRCEWSKQTTGRFFDMLADAGAEVTASMVVTDVDPADEDRWAQLASAARQRIATAAADELGPTSPVADRRNAAKAIKRPVVHLLCAVAAATGEACAGLSGVPSDLTQVVGEEVKTKTGSAVAGKLANAATKKLIELTVPQTALLAQVGFLADSAAVGLCPSQQQGGTPTDHPEVQQCAGRLERRVVAEMVETLLEPQES